MDGRLFGLIGERQRRPDPGDGSFSNTEARYVIDPFPIDALGPVPFPIALSGTHIVFSSAKNSATLRNLAA